MYRHGLIWGDLILCVTVRLPCLLWAQAARQQRVAQVTQQAANARSMHVVSGAPPGEDPNINPDGHHISGKVRLHVRGRVPNAHRTGLDAWGVRADCCSMLPLQSEEDHERWSEEVIISAELDVYEVSRRVHAPDMKKSQQCIQC